MTRRFPVYLLTLALLQACTQQPQPPAQPQQDAHADGSAASTANHAANAPMAQSNTNDADAASNADAQLSEAQRQAIALIGEPVPEFPVIPTIVVPDIVGVQPSQRRFEAAMDNAFNAVGAMPGIAVTPARCEGEQFLANNGGITRMHENGQIYRSSDNGVFRINPDGSGYASSSAGIVRVDESGEIFISGEAEADGSPATVRIQPNGSGHYSGRNGTIRLDGQGSGYWDGPYGTIRVESDGSGYWSGTRGTVRIEANGSGHWRSEQGTISNNGTGSGSWSKYPGKEIPMDPVPRVAPAGRFPPQQGFNLPGTPCGFVITLQDNVLFDFDKSDIRADAAEILSKLATALGQVDVQQLEIRGHTDAKGSDSYNQALSERRAQSVLTALRSHGLAHNMQARGFGETQPVEANEINGQDNPAGRQQNRRVEIFVKA